jgi:hypothetical protein
VVLGVESGASCFWIICGIGLHALLTFVTFIFLFLGYYIGGHNTTRNPSNMEARSKSLHTDLAQGCAKRGIECSPGVDKHTAAQARFSNFWMHISLTTEFTMDFTKTIYFSVAPFFPIS